LVERELAWGTLQLRSDTDTISLLDDLGWLVEKVVYPRLPIGYGSAPRPPRDRGSISHWNDTGIAFGWYVDSTGSPGQPNQNYSTISGTVTVPGESVIGCRVRAQGTYGEGAFYDLGSEYTIKGLGPGDYRVTVEAYIGPDSSLQGGYPDSVTVGYNEDVTGIDIVVASAVAEPAAQPPVGSRVPATLVHGLLFLPETAGVERPMLFDLQGRMRARLRPGANDVSHLESGVYFLQSGAGHKAPAVRKVIVQR
jgi:hypothetical protein